MKRRLLDIVVVVGALFLVIFIGYLVVTIENLKEQVSERDILLASKNDREESTLKDKEELVKSLSGLFGKQNLDQNGDFDVIKFIENHNNLQDSIRQLNWDLKFIYDTYGIKVNRKYNKDGSTTTSINPGEKVDSAMVLLSVFRDRLEKDNKSWTISTEGESYEDLRKRYNKKVEENSTLTNEKNKLTSENTGLKKNINFYKGLLEDMQIKGILKIDSTDNDISYTY